jgi:glucosamine 6-phosphate synthetase-like amidotransferase/phosphosugar isomerase protein
MLKEIHEQPRVLTDVLRGRVDLEAGHVRLDDVTLDDAALAALDSVVLTACGTAWHAALVGKFMIEQIAQRAGAGRLRLGVPLPRSRTQPAHGADRDYPER